MEEMPLCKDLYDPLDHKGVRPDSIKAEDWKKLNQKKLGTIRQYISEEVFYHIADANVIDAYTLWTKLEGMYLPKSS